MLGRGGFGAVYRVSRAGQPTTEALKLQQLSGADTTELGKGAIRMREKSAVVAASEADVLAKLSRAALAAGEAEGGVSHLCLCEAAGPLFHRDHKSGLVSLSLALSFPLLEEPRPFNPCEDPLGPEDFYRLAGQLMGALAFLHSNGVVHRDLMPNNVLLSGDKLSVIDFGLAVQTVGGKGHAYRLHGNLHYAG